MCSSKDPTEYPTLYHTRNMASKRYTAKDSLKLLSQILLSWAHDDAAAAEAEPMKFIKFSHSSVIA